MCASLRVLSWLADSWTIEDRSSEHRMEGQARHIALLLRSPKEARQQSNTNRCVKLSTISISRQPSAMGPYSYPVLFPVSRLLCNVLMSKPFQQLNGQPLLFAIWGRLWYNAAGRSAQIENSSRSSRQFKEPCELPSFWSRLNHGRIGPVRIALL